MSYQKTISGAINGKFDKIAISNTSTKIPIDIKANSQIDTF